MTNDVSDKLMKQIEQGEVAMRPRWHFALRSALFALIFLTVMLITLFVAGFLVLAMRVSGLMVMPGFGLRGVLAFLGAFPWLITLLLLVLMLIVEVYARRYSFCYRLPALGTLTILIMLIGTAGLSLGYYLHYSCPARDTVVGSTVGHFMEVAARQSDMIHAGTVRNFDDKRHFDLETPTEVYRVIVMEDAKGVKLEFIEVGDDVLVFGPAEGGMLRAIGLRKLPPEGAKPYHPRGLCPPEAERGAGNHRLFPDVINAPVNP